MTIDLVKIINNVDMGIFGKKNIKLELKISQGKDGWEIHCWYAYVVEHNGKYSPIQGNVISNEFIKSNATAMLDEVKSIADIAIPNHR